MSIAKQIVTNTVGQIILRVVEVVLGVITLGLITRYLGSEGFGTYTTVLAFVQLFAIIVDFGLYLTLLREIAANPNSETERITKNIFTIRVITIFITLLVAIVAVSATSFGSEIKWGVAALSVGFFFVSLTSTLTALFQKNLRMLWIAWLNVASKAVLLATTLLVIYYHADLQALFYSSSLSSALPFLFIAFLVRRLPSPVRIGFAFDFMYWRSIFSKTWPLALTTALNLIYFKADTVILSLFQNQESVGLYGASYRVVEIITTFPHMFLGLVMPLMTAAWVAQDISRLQKIWERAFVFFCFLALPMVAGSLVAGQPLMVLVAGPDFVQSGAILKILMVATAAIFFGSLYNYMVIVVDKQRAIIKYFLLVAIISLIGYLICIPLFSYWGAAWMTVVSEVLMVIGGWLVTRRSVRLPIPWITVAKIIISCAIMAIASYLVRPYVPILILLLFSIAVYSIANILLRTFSMKEISALTRS